MLSADELERYAVEAVRAFLTGYGPARVIPAQNEATTRIRGKVDEPKAQPPRKAILFHPSGSGRYANIVGVNTGRSVAVIN